MKIYTAILSAVIFTIAFAVTSYADHPLDTVSIMPYESMLKHAPWAAAGDLRYHITIHKPYGEWAKWPKKEKMSQGKEPHGAFLTTYVNEEALKSIKKAKGMAEGAVIVNEDFDAKKQLAGITVMYKVKDYNPGGGDWFWVKYDPKFNILAEGKLDECIKCHGSKKDNDYIYSGKVTGK